MNKTDIESFIQLKFFPVKYTNEYSSTIPLEVKEKVHQRIPGWHRHLSITAGFSFMLAVYNTTIEFSRHRHNAPIEPDDIEYNIHFEQTLRQALKEYYEN